MLLPNRQTGVLVASDWYVSESGDFSCPDDLPEDAILDDSNRDWSLDEEEGRHWTSSSAFPYDSTDTPQHCWRCEALLPKNLTSDGQDYVKEKVLALEGRPTILATWAEFYGSRMGLPYLLQVHDGVTLVATTFYPDSEAADAAEALVRCVSTYWTNTYRSW